MSATSPHLYRPRASSRSYPSSASPLQRLTTIVPHRRRRTYREIAGSYLTLTNALRLAWVLLLLHGERWVFTTALTACSWEAWESWPAHATPHRAVLIADPQLIDPHTYPRRGLALAATTFYTDQYMARSYATLQAELVPQSTLFLGDLFDGGREWAAPAGNPRTEREKAPEKAPEPDPRGAKDWTKYTHTYWMEEYVRFDSIFPALPGRRTVKTLPGNHDLGIANGIRESVLDRWRAYFGSTSAALDLGNHSVLLLDTVSLANDDAPRVHGPPRDFLESLPPRPVRERAVRFPHALYTPRSPPPEFPTPDVPGQRPTVLLTHVPLWRDPDTDCGPRREKGHAISIVAGYQYQNVLTAQLSAEILKKTAARWVFSADDHDACDVTHHYGSHGVVAETTVKAFSWAMGIRYPAFHMLSLWTGTEEETGARGERSVQHHSCALPDQLGVFLRYAQFGVFCVVALFAQAAWRAWRGPPKGARPVSPVLPTHKGSTRALRAEAASSSTPDLGGLNGRGAAGGAVGRPSPLGISTDGGEKEKEDGEGKYWKPVRMEEVHAMRERWGWMYQGWKEVRAVGVFVGVVYLWLIWRW